jgi:hypothetical protein
MDPKRLFRSQIQSGRKVPRSDLGPLRSAVVLDPVLWIVSISGLDPDSVGSLDPDPDTGGHKMTHIDRKKLINFSF